jgi:hypothetical protein
MARGPETEKNLRADADTKPEKRKIKTYRRPEKK